MLELLMVMVLVGVIVGIGVAGFDRADPGYHGLQATVEVFLESSRDRARSSGHPVVVVVETSKEEGVQRLKRYVFRRTMEATFEPRFRRREGVSASGSAGLEVAGRFGTGADLRAGGTIAVSGRGNPDLALGFSLDLDLEPRDADGGTLLHWEGLLDVRQRKGGILVIHLRAGDGAQELFQDVLIESPAGSLVPGRWQHLKLVAADGSATLFLDGTQVSWVQIPPLLGSPRSAVRFGADKKGWKGRIDEFTIWARVAETGPELPFDVRIEMAADKLVFDRHGTLDASVYPEGIAIRLVAFGDEISSFLVGRFTQEVAP